MLQKTGQGKMVKRLSEIKNLKQSVGLRVRALHGFSGVPDGTQGMVDEWYSTGNGHEGVMIAWDLPGRPLPTDYKAYDGRPAIISGLLRDGFGRDGLRDETDMLEILE